MSMTLRHYSDGMVSVFVFICFCDCSCIYIFVPELYSRSKQGGAIKALAHNRGFGMSGRGHGSALWCQCGGALVPRYGSAMVVYDLFL